MRLWSGAPLWFVRDGFRDPRSDAPRDSDVAIVGAGISGALLADSLTAAGLSVTVIDRRTPAEGSTAVCTGILTYEVDLELGQLAERIGEERAVRSYRACAAGMRSLAAIVETLPDRCGFDWTTSLYIGSRRADAKRLPREVELRKRHGLDAEFLDAGEVERAYDLKSHGVLRTELAAVVDSVLLTRALLDRAMKAGAVLSCETTVLGWTADANGVSITTTRGPIRARYIVFATGYETPPAFRDDLATLHSSYAIATRPLPGPAPKAARCILWNTERPYFYCRPAEGNRIVFGGEDLPFKNVALRDQFLPRRAQKLERGLDALLPGLGAETEFTWAGTFGATRDGLPFIGAQPDAPRALFALGYGGNGIVFSAIAAELLRNLILGEGHECLDLFAFGRE